MLNELRELSISLANAGICPTDFHSKFALCPKNKAAFWIYLDDEGNVSGVSAIPIEQIQQIRKWEGVGSNGTSFPAFSVPPLLMVVEPEHRKNLATMKRNSKTTSAEIHDIAEKSTNLWAETFGKKTTAFDKINTCLDKPVKDLLAKFSEVPVSYSAINTVLLRANKVDSSKFYCQLRDELIRMVVSGDTKVIEALFFYGDTNPTPQNDFQMVCEVVDWKDFPANHQQVQSWMNSRLLSSGETIKISGSDAFGNNASGKDNLFPSVRLPILGDVTLRAMNKESPCQTRYKMKEYHSFPAGEEARKGMKSALEWLGSAERKGKTWCDLSRRMEKPMLLFAYPSLMPQDLPDLAGMMGDVEDDSAEANDERFAVLSQKVTAALRGGSKETVDCEIRVFVLAKMDKARTKVLASSRFSAEHVIQSAQKWQDGCRNMPVIEVRCFGKNKGDKPVWSKPLVPFPVEVVWCLNTVWMRQGSHAEGAHGFTVNDALCLLLGEGFELRQTAGRALGTVIRNSSSLLLALGQAHSLGHVVSADRKYSKQTLLLPSILGLLLHKLGHKKGEIMTSPAFLVGRFLNLADSLHLEYCKGVRKGSVPPQLVGNALMATALETPEKALSMLSQRVLPYQAWARTVKEGDRVGLVKTFLKQLGEVSEQLKDATMPQRSSDADKAQMLLGYLARVES